MERLFYGLAIIAVTLACEAVPRPTNVGTGSFTTAIKLISIVEFKPKKVPVYMSYFPQTRIENYSRPLGHFTNLNSANVDGNFAYTFSIRDSDCEKVSQWMNEIVTESSLFKKVSTECYDRDTSTAEPAVPAAAPAAAGVPQSLSV